MYNINSGAKKAFGRYEVRDTRYEENRKEPPEPRTANPEPEKSQSDFHCTLKTAQYRTNKRKGNSSNADTIVAENSFMNL